YHIETLKAGDIVVSCKSFGLLLENLKKQDRSVYIVSETEKNVELLEQYCKKMQPELFIMGTSVYTGDMDGASVVNEIYSHIPDILLVDLPVGEQEKWIMDHAALLNAKICIAIGGVADLIMLPGGKDVPKWVQKLHISGWYRKLFSGKSRR
ncbi:MAG: WecB/TagA/CpsF family glycosyltransferase, partial [Lachnospiraceae bacterium]|nr:WecB/TagA/CpsF family glycosyltransferase [Lachnospiraceae bacterium]